MFKIAIIAPGKGESHNQVIEGFESIRDYCFPRKCQLHEFVLPYTAGDSIFRIQAGRIARQIKVGNFDLVYTVGASCSAGVKRALESAQLKVPHIFVGVSDPEGLGLLEYSSDGVRRSTGVSMGFAENVAPLEVVFKLYGLVRRIVLV